MQPHIVRRRSGRDGSARRPRPGPLGRRRSGPFYMRPVGCCGRRVSRALSASLGLPAEYVGGARHAPTTNAEWCRASVDLRPPLAHWPPHSGERSGARQCNRDGRLTTEACLCTWLTGLSDGEKYGLISQAASDAPLCLEGLEAVLQLGWYDMNVYIQTSTGMFSLAALVLCNHGRRSESSASEVVGRELASQEVSCTFIGHWHSGV